jgi:cyclopropane fatty-acyl-phospholipid synthase-like methyltransferase
MTVGNDFYRLWPRPTGNVGSYSWPGTFRASGEALDDAQEAKLESSVASFGCARVGSIYLDAAAAGARSLCTPRDQYGGLEVRHQTQRTSSGHLAVERIAEAGLERLCHVELRDYRDAPSLGPFDKVASVTAMVERCMSGVYDALGAVVFRGSGSHAR